MKVANSEKLGQEPITPALEHYRDDCYDDQAYYNLNGGLTKRELFAAMAMQGYCSCKIGEMDFNKVAELAVKQADALLDSLSK